MEKELVKAISTLLVNIKKYSEFFNNYRQQQKGYDLQNRYQEATHIPNQARESLKNLNDCLYHIKNDIIILKQILILNKKYPNVQINEANSYLIDLAGMCDSVNRRFHRLDNPDKLLLDVHNDFIPSLADLNSSIMEYNKNKTNLLFLLSEALEIFNTNTPNLF